MNKPVAVEISLPALPPLPTLLIPVMQALREDDTVLALNEALPNAVIVRRDGADVDLKLSVARNDVKDLISWGYLRPKLKGKICLYEPTPEGRIMVPETSAAPVTFQKVASIALSRESPVRLLARKKSPDGSPFLGPQHVSAADIFTEDFRMAGFADNPVGTLEEVMDFNFPKGTDPAVTNAHERLCSALNMLGPDLGDIVLRCCCFHEGIETAERRMGWSARSGKVVLRIALRRLVRHYEEVGAEYCYVS
ncbi:MAG: DUF6456 domain-containing protein [Pseudomonadota bacterium]